MPDDKAQKLKEILTLLSDSLTRKDFELAFSKVVEYVKGIDSKTSTELSAIKEAVETAIERIEKTAESNHSSVSDKLMAKADDVLNDVQFKVEALIAEAQAKIDEVHSGEDGEDGKDADEEAIVAKVLQQIKLPESEVIDVEKLKKEILDSIPRRVGGSIGASVIHKFIDDETPSGTINSSNTTFYLTKAPINGSLKLYLGGARQRVGEDFTLSNKTITFTIAPPTGSILLADYRHF